MTKYINIKAVLYYLNYNLTKSLINLYNSGLNPNQTIDPARNSHSSLEVNKRSISGERENLFSKSFYTTSNKIENNRRTAQNDYYHEDGKDNKSLDHKGSNNYLCNLNNKRSRVEEFGNNRYNNSKSNNSQR